MIEELEAKLETATGMELIDAIKTARQPQFKHLPILNSVSAKRYVEAFLEALPSLKKPSVTHIKLTLETLPKFMLPFASTDEFRESMSSIYFDDDYAVSTDMHKMMLIPNRFDKTGLYLLNTIVNRPTTDALVFTEEYKYPNYQVVIPTYDTFLEVGLDNIYNGLYHWKRLGIHKFEGITVPTITITFGDTKFRFNGLFFLDIVKAFLLIGARSVKVSYGAYDRAVVFEYNGCKALLMPMYVGDSFVDVGYTLDITDWITNTAYVTNAFFH